MNKPELQALLQTLRAEIGAARFSDPAEQQRLSATLAELEKQVLAGGSGAAPAEEGMVEGLKLAVEKFEVEYPRFAGLLNQLVTALSAMGI